MLIILLLATLFPNEPCEGSIIFIAHGCRIVEKVTDSSLTHVAIIFKDKGELYVYEATPPIVKKTPLSKYWKFDTKKEMCIAQPMVPFTKKEIYKMKEFAESSLGKRYSTRSYLTGEAKKGIHCSEFVTECLEKSKRTFSPNPSRVAPKNLWDSIERNFIFSEWTK